MIEVVTFPEMDTEGQEVSIHSSTLKVKKKIAPPLLNSIITYWDFAHSNNIFAILYGFSAVKRVK